MPEDPIMDMVNNIEPMYNDKMALYKKWIDQGEGWSEAVAHRNAMWMARRFAASLPGRHSAKDIREAADEMIEEFKVDERPRWSVGADYGMGDIPMHEKKKISGPYLFERLSPSDRRSVERHIPGHLLSRDWNGTCWAKFRAGQETWWERTTCSGAKLWSPSDSSGASLGAVEGWVVTHDGETIKSGFNSDFDAMKWLHDQHSYSVDHAVKHEGYDIVLVEDGEVKASYKRDALRNRPEMGKVRYPLWNVVAYEPGHPPATMASFMKTKQQAEEMAEIYRATALKEGRDTEYRVEKFSSDDPKSWSPRD